jgi:uncharacterized OB-fold protein
MPAVVPPVDSPDDRFFWDGAAAGELRLQRCDGCGRLRHPPRPMCPDCHALEWSSMRASGRGVVYSWIASRHPTEADAAPRIVILVDLEEGVRVVSNLVGVDESEVRTGAAVEVCFVRHESADGAVTLPQFRLAAIGAAIGAAVGAADGEVSR